MSYRLSTNAVQTYTEQLQKLSVKLASFPDDERATQCATLLRDAARVLNPEAPSDEPVVVEQPTDDEGNPLPPPSEMQLPDTLSS